LHFTLETAKEENQILQRNNLLALTKKAAGESDLFVNDESVA
jgi:hypothetical protein